MARFISVALSGFGFLAVVSGLFTFSNGKATLKPELVNWLSISWPFIVFTIFGLWLSLAVVSFLYQAENAPRLVQLLSWPICVLFSAIGSYVAYDSIWPTDHLAIALLVILYLSHGILTALITDDDIARHL